MRVICFTRYQESGAWVRIEGDYAPGFYPRLKEFVPKYARRYFPADRYWVIHPQFFCRIFELAYECFDRIDEFDKGTARQYFPFQST